MSDTFDHCLDAFESLNNDGWPEDEGGHYVHTLPTQSKLYETITDIKVVHETEKAYLIRDGKYQFWVPKSISCLHNNNIKIPTWFEAEYKRCD